MNLTSKQKGTAILVGVLALLYAANWQAVQWGYSPFLYCALRPVGRLFEGWLNIVNVILICFFAWSLISQNSNRALKAGIILVLVMGSPIFLDTILRLDGTCR